MPRELFREAIRSLSTVTNEPNWWPRTQAQHTVLAQAMAMEWATRDRVGSRGRESWVSTCWGRDESLQRKMLKHYGVSRPPEGRLTAARGNYRFSARQLLVDLSVWPTGSPQVKDLVHLTMESEMYSQHRVGASVNPDNGYSYDFFKILWCPSPRRLFIACVSGSDRRDTLIQNLNTVARDNAGFLRTANRTENRENDDELRVCLLPPAKRDRDDTRFFSWDMKASMFVKTP